MPDPVTYGKVPAASKVLNRPNLYAMVSRATTHSVTCRTSPRPFRAAETANPVGSTAYNVGHAIYICACRTADGRRSLPNPANRE